MFLADYVILSSFFVFLDLTGATFTCMLFLGLNGSFFVIFMTNFLAFGFRSMFLTLKGMSRLCSMPLKSKLVCYSCSYLIFYYY